MAKVDEPHRVLNLFDCHVIDQFDFRSWTYVNFLQRGESTGYIFDSTIELDLGRNQDAAVRVDAAHSAQMVALQQKFFLELNLIMPTQPGPDVYGGCRLEVGISILQRQFMLRSRPALIVKRSLSKNEMIVVEI